MAEEQLTCHLLEGRGGGGSKARPLRLGGQSEERT